jgi:hypothetical protein
MLNPALLAQHTVSCKTALALCKIINTKAASIKKAPLSLTHSEAEKDADPLELSRKKLFSSPPCPFDKRRRPNQDDACAARPWQRNSPPSFLVDGPPSRFRPPCIRRSGQAPRRRSTVSLRWCMCSAITQGGTTLITTHIRAK